MSFNNYWKSKGHVFGECMTAANTDLMYIHIPKNASSWTKPNLQDWGWEFYNYHTDDLSAKTPMVVLRDPVDRWVSGIAEYLYLYHKNIDFIFAGRPFFDLVFDRIAFDDHTEKQVYFLEDIDLSRCVFFKFGPNYREQFSQYLNSQGMTNRYSNYEPQHVSENSPERKRFKEIFQEQLKNSKYINQVQEYFKEDYQLIEQIQFYGTR
jgi:hypothetical protein